MSHKNAVFLSLVAGLALSFACATSARAQSAADTDRPPKSHATSGHGRTRDGADVNWDVTTSLLTLRAQRRDDVPARDRIYEPSISLFPGNYGLVVSITPAGAEPWRIHDGDREIELMSITVMLLGRADTGRPERSELLVGLGLSFFDRSVSLGVGIDLYRGVPILGFDPTNMMPVPGGGTAPTGVFGWAFGTEGQFTAENVSLLVNIDIVSIGTALGAAGGGGG